MAINTLLHKEDVQNIKSIEKDAFVKMNEKINPKICEEIYDDIKSQKLDIFYECNI